MQADFPLKHPGCGGYLTRTLTAPAVHYAAGGFYATDVARLRNQIGSDRYAKFEKQRDAATRRAATGTQTPYERALERVHA